MVRTKANQDSAGSREFYRKKLQTKRLRGCLENTTTKVAWQFSFGLAAGLLLASFDLVDHSFNRSMVVAAVLYVLQGMICLFADRQIRAGILSQKGEIGSGARLLGLLLILFICFGNFFASIAGFMLLKREKGIEYQLTVYSTLSLIIVFAVSCLNMLKPYVVDTYYYGMGLLLVMILFNLALLFLSNRWVKGRRVDKRILPLAVLSMLQICYGNLFGLVFGLIVISKYRHTDEDISIEWVDVVRRLFRNYMSVIGVFIVVFLISLSVVSLLTFDYDMAISNDYAHILRAPSLAYPFGTDNYGRCVFTRIVFGARISLIVGILATLLPIVVGGFLGAVAGYYGKMTDNTIMRALDILYAVPSILLAITIIAAFGANTVNLILALSVGSIPIYARTVRATVMSISQQEFVEAARACGAKDLAIILQHIIPNSLAPVIVRATLEIGGAVLSTSALSYLGLGVEPHIPEWGNILKLGSSYLETNPYIAIFPGLAIIILVLAFNYFGDGLRDALDPKLK